MRGLVEVPGQAEVASVCVLGMGYIGLPTAAFLADAGMSVVGVDVNRNVVQLVNDGVLPFVEPGLNELLARVVDNGNLSAQTDVPAADAFVIAVPTPFGEDHAVDPTYVYSATRSIAPVLTGGELIILESTSPPGLTQQVSELVCSLRNDLTIEPGRDNSVYFAHCPERVLPGNVMAEMAENDRIVGGINSESAELASSLYSRFVTGELLLTDATTAELAKLTENSFRDVNIAFANELSMICEDLGVDVWELIELANRHPRVNILNPGPGVGGHCIAVDPWFIVSSSPQNAKLIRAARERNDSKPRFVIEQVAEALRGISNPKIALLGLAFKANIDDLRQSPAVHIAAALADEYPGASIFTVEPNVRELPGVLLDNKNLVLSSFEEAVAGADVVVLLAGHREFLSRKEDVRSGAAIIDTCGAWRTEDAFHADEDQERS